MTKKGGSGKKIMTIVPLIGVFLFVQILGSFVFVETVNAQYTGGNLQNLNDLLGAANTAEFVPNPIAMPVQDTNDPAKKVTQSIEKSILSVLLGSLSSGASYFMNKLAYDGATYLASKAAGQKPLVFQDGFGNYIKDVGKDSVATAVEELGQDVGKAFGDNSGFHFCKPSNPFILPSMMMGIKNLYPDFGSRSGPSPKCTWSELSKKISGLTSGDTFENFGTDVLSQQMAGGLKVDQSDFGLSLGYFRWVDDKLNEGKNAAELSRLEGEGFKSLTAPISGYIKTPAQVLKEESTALTGKHQGEQTLNQIAGMYGVTNLTMLTNALTLFTATFANQLMTNLFDKGILPDPTLVANQSESVTNEYASLLNTNRIAAEAAFNFLFTTVPEKKLDAYDLLTEYATCPDSPGINNCVMDGQLKRALDRTINGKPMTIQQAIDDKFLMGNWSVIPPSREVDNTDISGCYLKGYCYSNIQKLRKARIFPLGFEIAALKADPDHLNNWTLEKIVKGYENCGSKGLGGPQYPYCHLIDPNWVLRVPEYRCESNVIGSSLKVQNEATRRSECVDISSCILEDQNGKCGDDFGYCLKEKNTWNIQGETCPAEFNSCRIFVNTKDNQVSSYLARTLDYGECNQASIGCKAYSLSKNNDAWVNTTQVDLALKKVGQSQVIYFNQNIEQDNNCPASADGCHGFFEKRGVRKDDTILSLRKAPDYLGCYDTATSTKAVIDWPKTTFDIDKLVAEQPKECNNFSQVCLEEENGCKKYTNTEGNPDFVGIVGNNTCPSSCLGYSTFKQEGKKKDAPHAYEPDKFPLYFIPTQADECPSIYEGCSEYTNLEAASVGGEKTEYYTGIKYCEKPTADGKNLKTYYSWEGSATTGYVIKIHKLLPINQEEFNYINLSSFVFKTTGETKASVFALGTPAYADDNVASLQQNYNLCNKTNYNNLINVPDSLDKADDDCHALYDDKGSVYYSLLGQTITVSAQCHPLRKTESNLYTDSSILDNTICTKKLGLWGDDPTDTVATNVCRRCYDGGQYTNGACVYMAITGNNESPSCKGAGNPGLYNGCRAYTGHAANTVLDVVSTITFEPSSKELDAIDTAKAYWSAGEIKSESGQLGQNSLLVDSNQLTYTFASGTLENTGWYEINFWVKGTPQNLKIYLSDGAGSENKGNFTGDPIDPAKSDANVLVPVGQDWKQYHLGPVQFTGNGNDDANKAKLVIERSFVDPTKPGPYFLDNVRVTRISDKLFIIKDSWKEKNGGLSAPSECLSDSGEITPAEGMPGKYLGCQKYEEIDGTISTDVYATNFDKMCRPQAEGCTAMLDSYNTLTEEKAVAYNVWCSASTNGMVIKDNKCTYDQPGVSATCDVPVNGNGCLITKRVILPEDFELPDSTIVTSTVIIPADTPLSAPIYLTKKPEYQCNPSNIGCEKLALQEQTMPDDNSVSSYKFSETTGIKNNPDNYENTLCSDDMLGCSEYKGASEISYFKDPKLTGNKLCTYNPNLELSNGTKLSGWFKNGVGRCSQDKTKMCQSGSDCGEGNSCEDTGTIPCYENYYQAGGKYGIWSNKSEKYNGFVGTCEDKYDQCVELIDPADSSGSGVTGKAYYIKLTQDLKSKSAEACKGKVSLKEGCVLLDRTDNPNKIYNSGATNDLSSASNPKYKLVNPVTATTTKYSKLDTNEIVKVEKSRSCSEWLACRDQTKVTGADNQVRNVCTQYRSCSATEPGVACTNWTGLAAIESDKFTENTYITRDTSWYGNDFSGYTLFNQYQINSIINVNFDDDIFSYMAHEVDPIIFTTQGEEGQKKSCDSKDDWEVCGLDNIGGNGGGGRCYHNKCIYPLSGRFPDGKAKDGKEARQYLEQGSCKSHPEQNSPYPQYVGGEFDVRPSADNSNIERKDFKGRQNGYAQTNICQNGDCSCEYQKISYKGAISADYWPLNKDINNIGGVCTAGDKVGNVCHTDADCSQIAENKITINGVCSRVENISRHIGLRGFCVEKDYSRPLNKKTGEFACLTWVPIDTSASKLDQFNNNADSGYYPAIDAVTKQSDGTDRTFGQVYCANATANSMGAVKEGSYGDILRLNSGDGYDFATFFTIPTMKFKNNEIIYNKLFNAYGDYIFDTKTISKYKNKDGECLYIPIYMGYCIYSQIGIAQKYMNMSSWANNSGQMPNLLDPFNMRVEYNSSFGEGWIKTPHTNSGSIVNTLLQGGGGNNGANYQDRLYTVLQHWAWHGGMYQGGLKSVSEIISKGITVDIGKSTFMMSPLKGQNYVGFNTLDEWVTKNCILDKNGKYQLKDCDLTEIIKFYNEQKINESIDSSMNDLMFATSADITNPDAVVLYASPLYYRNYLQSTDLTAVFDGYVTSSVKIYDNGKPIDLTTAIKYKLEPKQITGFSSFGTPNSEAVGLNPNGSYQFIAEVPFYNRLKLYNTQIRKMHFGPMIHSEVSKTIEEEPNPVITIDFDKLNNFQTIEKKTDDGSASYDLSYSVDDVSKGLYTFKIKMKPSNDTKYIAVRFFPTLEKTSTPVDSDLSNFFKELWDIFGKNVNVGANTGGNELGKDLANWKKVIAWKGGGRTAIVIWVDFDQYGEMKEGPEGNNQFRYHYMSTGDYDASTNSLWEKFPALLSPNTCRSTNGKPCSEESQKAMTVGVTPFLSVVAEIKPSCADYQLVYKDDKDFSKQTNKAWTDRVWKYGQFDSKGGDKDLFQGSLLKSSPWQPFGSIPLTGDNFVASDSSDGASWNIARRRFAFADPAIDGLFYGCTASALEGIEGSSYSETLIGNDFAKDWPVNVCSKTKDIYYQTLSKGGNVDWEIEASGADYLSKFFVGSLNRLNEDKQNTVWNFTAGYDNSAPKTLATGLIAPQIYSVNPVTCFGLKENGKNCTIGEANQFTVNRRNFTNKDYDGDNHPDEDQDGDDKPDPIIAKGYYNATANFFAFADKNRMPIRQVRVDWGDGNTVNDDRFGKYKNRKPYCMDNDDPSISATIGECNASPQLTCKKNEDCPDVKGKSDTCNTHYTAKNFGNAPRACEQSFFEFTHGYSCSESDITLEKPYVIKYDNLALVEKNALAKNGFTKENTPQVCAFTPKVQVMDNWDWCNGDCEGEGLGCSSKKVSAFGGEPTNECRVDNEKAWTSFNKTNNARIIVVPN